MQVKIQVRGYTPRPWKTQKGTGEQRYSGTFTVLDMDNDRPLMETFLVDRDFPSDEEMRRAAQFVGKTGTLVVNGVRTGQDGKVHFVGELEAFNLGKTDK